MTTTIRIGTNVLVGPWYASALLARSLTMTLRDVAVNNPNLASNPKLFTRPHLRDTREVDLARGAPLMSPAGVQRVGAFR